MTPPRPPPQDFYDTTNNNNNKMEVPFIQNSTSTIDTSNISFRSDLEQVINEYDNEMNDDDDSTLNYNNSNSSTTTTAATVRPRGIMRQRTTPRSNKTTNKKSMNSQYNDEQSALLLLGSMDDNNENGNDAHYMYESLPSSHPDCCVSTPSTPKVRSNMTLKGTALFATEENENEAETPMMLPKSFLFDKNLQNTEQLLPVIGEYDTSTVPLSTTTNDCADIWKKFAKEHLHLATFIGSFMVLLYHIVFCLAMGSAIIRPSTNKSILGLMTKMAASGVIFASPIYLIRLGSDISITPATDLFLAPFLAKLAATVDEVLAQDSTIPPDEQDDVFMSTFAVLSGLGMLGSACLIVLSSKFKLANLGSFLPYPVLCGFFTVVGIMTWSLAFHVDTGGKGLGKVLFSGDGDLIRHAVLHHLPSFCAAYLMRWVGPKNPLYTSFVIIGTIALFYAILGLTGMTLADAKDAGWFWAKSDLVYQRSETRVGFDKWAAPAPFGVWMSLYQGKVHWGAVWEGMSMATALSFLYLLRCSLHSAALKKSVASLVRTARPSDMVKATTTTATAKRPNPHRRRFSEVIDIEASFAAVGNKLSTTLNLVRAKQSTISLASMLNTYAISQSISVFVGSFGVAPAMGVGQTMFSLGAEGVATQYGAIILLTVFYLTNFELVAYIPKTAFSSLMVLSFLDMINTWCFKSYQKTKDKTEWLVVPVIVVFAFTFGMLQSVFLGIALSTFIFVAAFFRTGVVKFMATGLTVRSTIERSVNSGNWLDENGDKIQILVLQNYLFFGNASSLLAYISSMFEEPDESDLKTVVSLPPLPKYLILDLTLVSGMDTSTADIFLDIKQMCKLHDCKLFCSGISSRLSSVLALGNFKPERGDRSKRQVRFFADLDSAIGKAEDNLLLDEFEDDPSLEVTEREDPRYNVLRKVMGDGGFRYALREIDEQHGSNFSNGLLELYDYTIPVELEPGQSLYHCNGGPIADSDRGLFFIEQGLIKIERNSSSTVTRGSNSPLDLRAGTFCNSNASLTQLNARLISGQVIQRAHVELARSSSTMRLARIGPGWIVGALEFVTGSHHEGQNVAGMFPGCDLYCHQ